jgi:hypothetical protein
MIDVERVDFIRVPVTDMEEANHFYGRGLHDRASSGNRLRDARAGELDFLLTRLGRRRPPAFRGPCSRARTCSR